jgi:pentatricopeptide repeat protein
MASQTHLPKDFFSDVSTVVRGGEIDYQKAPSESSPHDSYDDPEIEDPSQVEDQIRLLQSIRQLEEKLAKARNKLDKSIDHTISAKRQRSTTPKTVELTIEDYKGLVDLYYYSQRDRFTPLGPDYSPSPTFLEEYSFKLSAASGPHTKPPPVYHDEVLYETPLDEVEVNMIHSHQNDNQTMQNFVDLLLDDNSSPTALFYAYRRFHHPGVKYLPRGMIRVFLQRMSTPQSKSRAAAVRYLSLIDDMQLAKLPITQAEWSSAIYMAGQSIGRVTQHHVESAMKMWRQMEHEAGVMSTHVTFNILFDIAVRAGKYTLAESTMREMYRRDLRLNRLGRVSLIYYHGLRRDGDGVRRTYRDFVEAGEIVDTVVMNCVIASLMNAGEPEAADQVYQRMQDLQKRLRTGQRPDGSDTLYIRYPGPGDYMFGREMASQQLGHVLKHAPRLKKHLPGHHADLQDLMPLRPDHMTFRAMISYHANVSANLDRITVLMKEMTDVYKIPVRNAIYVLLFKGFALHGVADSRDGPWNYNRLEAVWGACRSAVKEARERRKMHRADEQTDEVETVLPKLVHGEFQYEEPDEDLNQPTHKRPGMWKDYEVDIASFTKDRREPIERIHAQLFDDAASESNGFFANHFFPAGRQSDRVRLKNKETFYPLGTPGVDRDEGEYVLPSPSVSAVANSVDEPDVDIFDDAWDKPRKPSPKQRSFPEEVTMVSTLESPSRQEHLSPADGLFDFATAQRPTSTTENSQPAHSNQATNDSSIPNADTDANTADVYGDKRPPPADEVYPGVPMACWLLRAYTKCTYNRAKIEEVYNSLRHIYRPNDQDEVQRVVRVLVKCLKACETRDGG